MKSGKQDLESFQTDVVENGDNVSESNIPFCIL
jgi:hypothetical protein